MYVITMVSIVNIQLDFLIMAVSLKSLKSRTHQKKNNLLVMFILEW